VFTAAMHQFVDSRSLSLDTSVSGMLFCVTGNFQSCGTSCGQTRIHVARKNLSHAVLLRTDFGTTTSTRLQSWRTV